MSSDMGHAGYCLWLQHDLTSCKVLTLPRWTVLNANGLMTVQSCHLERTELIPYIVIQRFSHRKLVMNVKRTKSEQIPCCDVTARNSIVVCLVAKRASFSLSQIDNFSQSWMHSVLQCLHQWTAEWNSSRKESPPLNKKMLAKIIHIVQYMGTYIYTYVNTSY